MSHQEPQRRILTFVERLDGAQHRTAPPHYINLATLPSRVWRPAEECAFSVDRIHDAIGQTSAWKLAFGFPADISHGPSAATDWRDVSMVRPEHYLAVIVDTPDASAPLKGFAIRAETMMPHPNPLFALPKAARELLPDFFPALPKEVVSTNEFELIGDGMVRAIHRRP